MIRASLPILIRLLDQMKLRVESNPSQFALAQDTLRRTIRSLEWNLVLNHLVDSPTLAGKLFHPSNMHSLTSRISSKCPLDYDTASCQSMKDHVNPFPVTVGALVSLPFWAGAAMMILIFCAHSLAGRSSNRLREPSIVETIWNDLGLKRWNSDRNATR